MVKNSIEKPDHIHGTRMRHISDADLFAALDLSLPGLKDVRAAAESEDWQTAYIAWSVYFANRKKPAPVVHKEGYRNLSVDVAGPHLTRVLAEAEKLHDIQVDYTDRTKGKSGLYGFHYMYWLVPLVDAYALKADERHVEAFVRLFSQWYDARDQVHGEWPMDVIWYTLGLGVRSTIFTEAYHTFRKSPTLEPSTQAKLLKSFLGAARWLAEEHDSFRYGNWQIQGAASLFELAAFWPEFREAAGWREIGWARLMDHLTLDVYSDGGHGERAPSYHSHVMSLYTRVALASELAGLPRLQDHPRFRAMYTWLTDHSTPLGCSTNFNDSQLIWVGPHAAVGAVIFGDPKLKWLAEQFASPEEIAWTLATLPDRPNGQPAVEAYAELSANRPEQTSRLQPFSKYAFMQSGHDSNDLYMAINYGPVVGHELESHSHLDTLSFICTGYGVPLAIEAGCPASYDDPQYHEWFHAARAHNMVTVDDANPDEDTKDAELLAWSTSSVADLFQASHEGYKSKGVSHRRTILFVGSEYWLIHDELTQSGAHCFGWTLYTPQPLSVAGDCFRPAHGPGLLVLPVAATTTTHTEMVHGMMSVVGKPAYQGTYERRDVTGVKSVQKTKAARVIFSHVLYPVPGGRDLPSISVRSIAVLGATGEACCVDGSKGRDLLVVGSGVESARRQVGDWESDAGTWLVRGDGSCAIFGGSYLEHAGVPYIRASWQLKSIAMRLEPDCLAGEVEAVRKTKVYLVVNRPYTRVILDGVVVPQTDEERKTGHLLLPCQGKYSFRIEHN